MNDLFDNSDNIKPSKKVKSEGEFKDNNAKNQYSAKDIEVLEGLEPVRRRPGMYIGGTDERGLHHLAAEIIDNAMDEAVAGHASRIDIYLSENQALSVTDNGRGIPIDPHPKFKKKSALEVILTTLHSGGKFSGDIYETSGGLHGVGLSVVNALSDHLRVEVARDKILWSQTYMRGQPCGPIKKEGVVNNRRGTTIIFHPDAKIFGARNNFRPSILYRMSRSKAYLFRGIKIRWLCDAKLINAEDNTPTEKILHFPGGLEDFLVSKLDGRRVLAPEPFAGRTQLNGSGKLEWAVSWPLDEVGFFNSYCNTIPTPLGGTHELGLRNGMAKGLRSYGELINNKQAAKITADDIVGDACIMLSLFIRDPQFQGQTKDRLNNPELSSVIDSVVRPSLEHWLNQNINAAKAIVARIILAARAREASRAAQQQVTRRGMAASRLNLPGKLSDCTGREPRDREIFIVEGDSAGGSAKQARDRRRQAVLPLRGKVLNVESASQTKVLENKELSDLVTALGCGLGKSFDLDRLRYHKVIVLADADSDGNHIATLLLTFLYRQMPKLIAHGRVFLAQPPLYRIDLGKETFWALDEADRDRIVKSKDPKGKGPEITRFKGLGEMMPRVLWDTTMNPDTRRLLKVEISDHLVTDRVIQELMGKDPSARYRFIMDRADEADGLDV